MTANTSITTRVQTAPKPLTTILIMPAPVVYQDRARLPDLFARLQMAGLPPAARHAGLRKGERQEHADGIQWDQAVTLAWKRMISRLAITAREMMPRE